jgi:hypothetical protein
MSAVYEINLNPRPERFSVTIAGKSYRLTTHYANAPEGGWLLDIADAGDVPLACGLPLVTGRDMLEALAYLGIGVILFVLTDGAPQAVPTYQNLGVDSHLYFEA